MTKQYYTDGVARVFYEDIKQSLAEWTSRQLDGYELSHVGVKRNNEFEEILFSIREKISSCQEKM